MFEKSPIKLSKNIKHVEFVLTILKLMTLVFFTIFWTLKLIIKFKYPKYNSEDKNTFHYIPTTLRKVVQFIDQIMFWKFVAIILFTSVVLLFVFKESGLYVFRKHFTKFTPDRKVSLVPREYLSLSFWLNIWIIFITVLAVITKYTNDIKWILFGF